MSKFYHEPSDRAAPQSFALYRFPGSSSEPDRRCERSMPPADDLSLRIGSPPAVKFDARLTRASPGASPYETDIR